MNCCIFCLRHRTRFEGEPESSCTYKAAHELEDGTMYALRTSHDSAERGIWPVEDQKKVVYKQSCKPKDKKLCTKCGLHPKNPMFSTNGCAHEFESDAQEPAGSQGAAADARTEGASNPDTIT